MFDFGLDCPMVQIQVFWTVSTPCYMFVVYNTQGFDLTW